MKPILVLVWLFLSTAQLFGQNYEFVEKSTSEARSVFNADSLQVRGPLSVLMAAQQEKMYYLVKSGKALTTSYSLDSGATRISMDSAICSNIYFRGHRWTLRLENDNFQHLDLEHCTFEPSGEPLLLSNLAGDDFQLGTSMIRRSPFSSNILVKRILFYEDTLSTPFNFYGFELPERLILRDLRFRDDGMVDLTTFSDTARRRCLLYLTGTDISKLKFNYDRFDLDREGLSGQQIENVIKQIMLNQQQAGYRFGYQKADIELRQFEASGDDRFGQLANWIQLHWNNYGYSKEKIFINALILFGIFFLINLTGYGRLLREAYTLNQLEDAYKDLSNKYPLIRVILYVFYGMFFTGIVFWGLKLDPDKLKLKTNAFLSLWIIIQYVAGLIVLAYIANIIIGK